MAGSGAWLVSTKRRTERKWGARIHQRAEFGVVDSKLNDPHQNLHCKEESYSSFHWFQTFNDWGACWCPTTLGPRLLFPVFVSDWSMSFRNDSKVFCRMILFRGAYHEKSLRYWCAFVHIVWVANPCSCRGCHTCQKPLNDWSNKAELKALQNLGRLYLLHILV